jgi:hypothetical protein
VFSVGAVAPASATINIQVLGVQETLKDMNGPLIGYKVTGLMPSADPVRNSVVFNNGFEDILGWVQPPGAAPEELGPPASCARAEQSAHRASAPTQRPGRSLVEQTARRRDPHHLQFDPADPQPGAGRRRISPSSTVMLRRVAPASKLCPSSSAAKWSSSRDWIVTCRWRAP